MTKITTKKSAVVEALHNDKAGKTAKKAVTKDLQPNDLVGAGNIVVPAELPYAVMQDNQGVGYLRVAFTKNGAKLIINTGNEVQLVEMNTSTLQSRGLVAVPEASVLDAAQILAKPLSESIKVSARAVPYLSEILNNKELVMANKETKEAKKSAKAAAKSAAPKKAAAAKEEGTGKRGRAPVNSTIKLVKSPKDGELKGQALAITEILKEAGKSLPKAELIAAIGKKIPSKNVLGAGDIWAMNRKKLIDGGFVEEKAAA